MDSIKSYDIYNYVLNSPKFISLFGSSLEMQKYIFIREILSNIESETKLASLFKKEPFKKYVVEVMRGEYGDVYT